MKLEISIDDKELEKAIIDKISEVVVAEHHGIYMQDKQLKNLPLYEVRRAIEKIFKENASFIEEYVREEVRYHVKNSAKAKNGKLHIAIEKALKEMEEAE